MGIAGIEDVKSVGHPGEGISREGPVLEVKEDRDGQVESECEEEDDASFTDQAPALERACRWGRSGDRREVGRSPSSGEETRTRPDVRLPLPESESMWRCAPLPDPAFSHGHVVYAATVNVKTASTQSRGSVASTRYSLGCPTIGSTVRLGPVVRHDVVGSFVEYPVSWPTGALAAGRAPCDHNVRSTVWPFQSPEYRYAGLGCDVVVVVVLEVVLDGTVVAGTEGVVVDGTPAASGTEEVVDDGTPVEAADEVVVDAAGAD